MPVFRRNICLSGEDRGEDDAEAFDAMRGQSDSFVNRIDQPSKDDFDGVPGSVAFQQFFDGSRVLPEWRVFAVQRPKHLV